MIQIDAATGLAGVLAASALAYAAVRGVQIGSAARARAPAPVAGPLGPEFPAPLAEDGPAPVRVAPRVRRVGLAAGARTPRPGARRAAAGDQGPWELLSLIGTMQWDRALALIEAQPPEALPGVASLAEAAALERVRALPESDARLSLGGYRVLAALAPGNPAYAERVAQCLAGLDARREALLKGLTRDEDSADPGMVWLNHPWNPRFDDVRRPIWLYIGCGSEGEPRLRLRTNWLGDSRISVRGLEVVHDGITETLTRGAYKIDADALGWEWRDEEADPYQVEVLRSLTSAGEVTLRYRGDPWPCDAELAEAEKEAVGEMIELYDLLRAAPLRLRQAA